MDIWICMGMKSTQKMSEENISNFYFLCIYVQTVYHKNF